MRKEVIKQLLAIHLKIALFNSNPSSYQKKYAGSILRIIVSIVFSSLFYSIIFGAAVFIVPLEQLEDIMNILLGLTCMLLVMQATSATFSVFYESNDLQDFRAYPFKEAEIIVSKGCSILLTLLTYIIPIYIMTTLLFLRFNYPLWLSMIFAFPLILFVSLVFLLFSFAAISLLAKASWFGKYQKIFAPLMIAFNYVLGFGVVYLLRFLSENNLLTIHIPVFRFIYLLAAEGLTVESLIHIGVWVSLLFLLLYYVQRKVLPHFYEDTLKLKQANRTTRKPKHAKKSTLHSSLWRYNLGLIKNSGTLLYLIVLQSIFPITVIGHHLFDELELTYNGLNYIFATSIAGFAYAFMTCNASNLTAVIISLDGPAYEYLQSIPFPLATYLKIKFKVAYVIQNILPMVIIILLLVWKQLPFITIPFALISYALTALLMSMYYFCRDYRLLKTNWKDIQELILRGKKGSGCLTGFIYFLGILLALAAFAASTEISVAWAIFFILLLWMVLIIANTAYYFARFKPLLKKHY